MRSSTRRRHPTVASLETYQEQHLMLSSQTLFRPSRHLKKSRRILRLYSMLALRPQAQRGHRT